MSQEVPTVLVIGAGFGGLEVCKRLKNSPVRVNLVDKHNYHLFQPLLYQVASAALSPADIAHPIRRIFRNQQNVQVYLAEAHRIDLENRKVFFGSGCASYDYLVLAAGATHFYFGNDQWREEAPGLKSIDDATEIRKRVLLAFEEAEYEGDRDSRRAKLTFVIVGGGPTGVELAGALKEIAADTIPDDFRNVDTSTARIILVHAGDRLLEGFDPSLSDAALRDLQRMGVEVRLKSRVTSVDEDGVDIGAERLKAQNVFWAAGVQAAPIGKTLNVPLDSAGRVLVEPDLTIPGHPEVFVIGDMAHAKDRTSGGAVPGVAAAAVQGGRFVGTIIAEEIDRRIGSRSSERPEFRYVDRGSMATIGKAKAVAQLGPIKVSGFVAWVMWCVLHVLLLIGFRNRLSVVISWIGSYLVSSRGARLITGRTKYTVKKFTETLPHDGGADANLHEVAPARSQGL